MSTSSATINQTSRFVICTEAGEYAGELVPGKVYRLARPERNDPPGDLRVVDESGEDYLYPRDWFVPVSLPAKARRALARL